MFENIWLWMTLLLLIVISFLLLPVALTFKTWWNHVKAFFSSKDYVWVIIKGKDSRHHEYFLKSKNGIIRVNGSSYAIVEEGDYGAWKKNNPDVKAKVLTPKEVFIKGRHAVYEFNEDDVFPHVFRDKDKLYDSGLLDNAVVRAATLADDKKFDWNTLLLIIVLAGVAACVYFLFTQQEDISALQNGLDGLKTALQVVKNNTLVAAG